MEREKLVWQSLCWSVSPWLTIFKSKQSWQAPKFILPWRLISYIGGTPQSPPFRRHQQETNFVAKQVEWNGTNSCEMERKWNETEWSEMEWTSEAEKWVSPYPGICFIQTDTHQNKKNYLFSTQTALNKHITFRERFALGIAGHLRSKAELVRKARPKGTPKVLN